ncbi:ExbD/TolR family protein [Sessilibacter sp. MAH4]
MKQSLRAKRMAKHHKRNLGGSKLNLVSLMDIFTILVFFLLINSDDVEILQNQKDIILPESVSEQKPDSTLLILANNEDLIVSGQIVAKVPDILAREDLVIAELKQVLTDLATQAGPLPEELEEKGRPVTIMGDAEIPYEMLKRIMQTCVDTEFRDVSMAVSQVPSNDPVPLAEDPVGAAAPAPTGEGT